MFSSEKWKLSGVKHNFSDSLLSDPRMYVVGKGYTMGLFQGVHELI